VYNVPPDGLLQSFLQNGVISGIGSVIIFLPQILILFLFILLLEDLGYMARAAFLMDRIMGGAGLHGRAFIPLLSSFACAIPGIMATRVIDNTRAKFFFWRDDPTPPFMLELPDYKLPRPRSIIIGVLMRAKMFLQRAGTTIFSMMALIWFLASFPRPPAGAQGPDINYSLAAMIGRALQPVLAPVGFNWQINVTLIQGMAAREVAVAALGTVYANQGGKEAVEQIGHVLASKLSLATALSIPVWYIFAPQCASTLAVIKRETGSWRWMAITFAYMLALAYVAAFITYNVAVAMGAG
jgi:ferrous iron transport protein B